MSFLPRKGRHTFSTFWHRVQASRSEGAAGKLSGRRGNRSLDGFETPDATLEELSRLYNRRVPRARRSTRASVHRALQRADFVLKKNARGPQKSTGRMWQRNAPRS